MPRAIKSSGPNAPPRPRSSFNLYMQYRLAQSEELSGRPFAERSRLIGGEWSAMSKEQKQIYNEQATREREKYKVDLAAYKKTQEYQDWAAKQENEKPTGGKGSKKSAKGKREAEEDMDDLFG